MSIKTGYDWALTIPALNRTVYISEIKSDHHTTTLQNGIFSMDKRGVDCANTIYSLKQDNQTIDLSQVNPYGLRISITR